MQCFTFGNFSRCLTCFAHDFERMLEFLQRYRLQCIDCDGKENDQVEKFNLNCSHIGINPPRSTRLLILKYSTESGLL